MHRTQAGDRFSTSSAEDFRQRNGQVASSCTDNSCPAFLLLNIHRHMATKMNKTRCVFVKFDGADYAIYKFVRVSRGNVNDCGLSMLSVQTCTRYHRSRYVYFIRVLFFFFKFTIYKAKRIILSIQFSLSKTNGYFDRSIKTPLLSGENRYNQYATER